MKRPKFITIIGLLVFLDQCIRLYINHNLIDKNFNILSDYIQFKPHLNVQYSWINSLFNLGINRTIHIISAMLILAFLCLVYIFVRTMYIRIQLIEVVFILTFGASICSLIDKMFWGGSLDYISLKGLFIFDLKDLYITIMEVLLLINFRKIMTIDDKKLTNNIKKFTKIEINKLRNKARDSD